MSDLEIDRSVWVAAIVGTWGTGTEPDMCDNPANLHLAVLCVDANGERSHYRFPLTEDAVRVLQRSVMRVADDMLMAQVDKRMAAAKPALAEEAPHELPTPT